MLPSSPLSLSPSSPPLLLDSGICGGRRERKEMLWKRDVGSELDVFGTAATFGRWYFAALANLYLFGPRLKLSEITLCRLFSEAVDSLLLIATVIYLSSLCFIISLTGSLAASTPKYPQWPLVIECLKIKNIPRVYFKYRLSGMPVVSVWECVCVCVKERRWV